MDRDTRPLEDPAGSPPLRGQTFVIRRKRWPGLVAAGLVGGAVAAAFVSSFYDDRSIGQRIDAGVAVASDKVEQGVGQAQLAASGVVQGTAEAMGRVGETIVDANITAAVKTALAADPALSALAINVTTENGIVRLEGPAPNPKARERAEVIAAAPDGVNRVDNRLVVTSTQ